MTLEISLEHQTARTAASLAFASNGTGGGKVSFYASSDYTGTPLVEVLLADPPGEIVDGLIVLAQAEPTGDLIAVSGSAASAVWSNAAGEMVARGLVTDETGVGPFKVQGTTGTALYAGGRMVLGVTALG